MRYFVAGMWRRAGANGRGYVTGAPPSPMPTQLTPQLFKDLEELALEVSEPVPADPTRIQGIDPVRRPARLGEFALEPAGERFMFLIRGGRSFVGVFEGHGDYRGIAPSVFSLLISIPVKPLASSSSAFLKFSIIS